MKRITTALLTLLCVLASAGTRETVTLTVTNIPVIGETLTINGTTKTWAASATNSNYIAVGASIAASTTNLWSHYATYVPSGPVVVTMTATNVVTLTGTLNQTMTVTSTTNWVTITTATNTTATAMVLRVPFSVEASTNRTNNANQLIADLGVNATTAASATAPWLANYASLSESQTITGAKTMTGANVFGGGTITNMGLGTIRLPYRTNAPSGIILDNLTNYTYAIAPDYAGRPALWDVSVTSNLTTYAGAMSSLSGGSIMNKATADTVYGGLSNTNTWTGPNTFSGSSGITGSIITNSTVSGTISKLSAGTITNSTLRNVVARDSFLVGSGGGMFRYQWTVSEQAVDGDNAAFPTTDMVGLYEIGNGVTAAWNLAGLADGYPGKVIAFYNATGYGMSILNQSGLESVATNRIVTGTGGTVSGVQSATFIYNGSAQRWLLMSSESSSSPSVPIYGELYIHDGATSRVLTNAGTYYLLNQTMTAGNYSGVTLSTVSNTITVATSGKYLFSLTISFSGTLNETYEIAAHTNGVEAVNCELKRKLGSGGDVGSSSSHGILNLTAGMWVDVRATAAGASASITPQQMQFSLRRID